MAGMLLMLSGRVWAQEPQPAAPETPAPVGGSLEVRTHEDVIVVEEYPEQPSARRDATDKKFWVVSGLLGTAMMFDTKSTFDVLNRCARCHETNPYAAPFVNRGPAAAVGAGIAFDIGVMAVAKQMKGSTKPQLRRTWWIAPVAITAAHVVAYRHNLAVAR